MTTDKEKIAELERQLDRVQTLGMEALAREQELKLKQDMLVDALDGLLGFSLGKDSPVDEDDAVVVKAKKVLKRVLVLGVKS